MKLHTIQLFLFCVAISSTTLGVNFEFAQFRNDTQIPLNVQFISLDNRVLQEFMVEPACIYSIDEFDYETIVVNQQPFRECKLKTNGQSQRLFTESTQHIINAAFDSAGALVLYCEPLQYAFYDEEDRITTESPQADLLNPDQDEDEPDDDEYENDDPTLSRTAAPAA